MGETPRLKTAIQKKDENGLTYYQRYYRLHKDEILEKTRKNNKKIFNMGFNESAMC